MNKYYKFLLLLLIPSTIGGFTSLMMDFMLNDIRVLCPTYASVFFGFDLYFRVFFAGFSIVMLSGLSCILLYDFWKWLKEKFWGGFGG